MGRGRLGPGVALAFLLAGCALSTSSRSSSDAFDSSETSSRSSASSSRSSAGSGRQMGYREDVRTFTAAYVRSGAELAVFHKHLGDVARRHGLTDWEHDPATYLAIGEGLGDAAVTGAELDRYELSLSGSDPDKLHAIQRGYDTRR